MGLYENAAEFFGRPVRDWTPEEASSFNYTVYVPRVRLDYDDIETADSILTKRLRPLLARADSPSLTALVIGMWGESYTPSSVVVNELVAQQHRLPNLQGMFLGDIVSEENEISWIYQSDVSSLWAAFPNLRELRLRGGNELAVGRITLPKLEMLVIETGGLPKSVVTAVLGSPLQSLTHLELWLGSDNYGADTGATDFAGLELANMPALRSLGLLNSEYTDELVKYLANAPVLARIKRLDLSEGTLGDAGAEILLSTPIFARLEELDVHHHYMTTPVMERLRKLGPKVNVDGQEEEEEYGRYIAVSE